MTVQPIAAPKRKRLPKLNTVKLNLFLDIGLALAFVVELERDFTGMRNHELIGITMGIALLIHILLHWKWIWGITKQFFRNLFHTSRLNYVLNLTLMIDMVVIIVTGSLISETLGLNLGIARSSQMTFRSLHFLASDFSLMLVAAHVAIHWKWILSNTKKYIFRITSGKAKPAPSPAAPALTFKPSSAQE
jgi:hypothetical protein